MTEIARLKCQEEFKDTYGHELKMIGAEFGYSLAEQEIVEWKAKYEKCIKIIKRFDAGIIGMYDL